jgi:hypothetical protein
MIVARGDRPEVYSGLQRSFSRSRWVGVIVERRRGQRRQGAQVPAVERRLGGRRSDDRHSAQTPAYRLAHRGDGFEVFEAAGVETAECPQCGAVVSIELPRFAEPPVRLEIRVVHESGPLRRARHLAELESLSPTGRVLLATRLVARPVPEVA